ncbi:MAG TPA: S8 family serine peptidase [Candidatus Limnocylindrales bacterium]
MFPSRIGRAAAAVILAASVLSTASPVQSSPPKPKPDLLHGKQDKLGRHDRDLLTGAVRDKKVKVRAMLAVDPARVDAVAKAVKDSGGEVGSVNARLGYLRASLPTGKVDAVAQHVAVRAVDLDEQIKLGDPDAAAQGRGLVPYAAGAPGANTPAANPYLPVNEIGAVDFTVSDGRGTTIGILDSGIDLDHPALATTTTGERKIVDWVTATDPVSEGDGTWLRMARTVNATPTFRDGGMTFTAPAPGEYRFEWFSEWVTQGDNEINGDVNGNGNPYDRWGVLYRPSDRAIWVDSDSNGVFDGAPMRPYREAQQIGHFGRMPFVVESRPDPEGDFVSIGLAAGAHGTHVAGIAAGNGLFGGAMRGAAPGAKLVSSRACTWQGGCTAVALTEGMIDLVVNRGVDVVNMSIGGLPALNDGANARTILYDNLIDAYGVQIFISAGNTGPGLNTVGDPSVASKVVSVGASVSRETWAADYGSDVATSMSIFNFSSRGPREDGGFKPDIVAPGAAVSTINTWLPGEAVPGAGYDLPAGYGMFNGTSMASPQAAGAAALLLSAAKAEGRNVNPAQLRTALFDGAKPVADAPVHAQGNGLINVGRSWDLLRRNGIAPSTYTIEAPVCTPLSDYLTKPGRGQGLYDRCGSGLERSYEITITRTSGPAGNPLHRLEFAGDSGFKASPDAVRLPLGVPVTARVKAKVSTVGVHSGILLVDDPQTPGNDARMMATIAVAAPFTGPGFTNSFSGNLKKAQTTSFLVTVPRNAKTLQIGLGAEAGGKLTFTAQHPYGVPAAAPNTTAINDPIPGVWEIVVESSRSSATEHNPFGLDVAVFGVVASAPASVGTLKLHEPAPVSWPVTNHFGPVELAASTSPLGSRRNERASVGQGEQLRFWVDVPLGTKRFEARIGNPSDSGADLDLIVAAGGIVLGISADADSDERVVIDNPPAGAYQIIIDGYAVPSTRTEFDYLDDVRTGTLGTVATAFAAPIRLATGGSATVDARVSAGGLVPAGRKLHGTLDLTNPAGSVVGQAEVTIAGVTGPPVHLRQTFGPMNPFTARGDAVAGSAQTDGRSVPARWTPAGGIHRYTGYEGHIFSLNGKGDGAGQSEHVETPTLPGIFHADGRVTEVPLPGWNSGEIYGRAFAIDGDEAIVGNITAWDPGSSFRNDPFLWTASGGYVKLAHLTTDPYSSEPLAINSHGLIVGASWHGNDFAACWWDKSGAVHEIAPIEGDYDSVLLSVNDSGVAVGSSGGRAAIWTAEQGLRRLPDLGFLSEARAIRADGWIIGYADAGPWDPHVVAWDPQGNLYDLNGLLVDVDKFYMSDAVGINDLGFVAWGQALDGSDASTAIIGFQP